MLRFTFLTWMLLFSVGTAAEGIRDQVDLNGTWQYQRARQLETPPETGDWRTTEVPGTFVGYDYQRVWLRREFSLPETMRGKRIKIQFDGVKYNSRIYINGKHIGGCYNGYDAFQVDATNVVRFGSPNQLAVGCHDWTGVFSDGKFDFSEKPSWQRPRRYVTDKVIAPIGGHYDHYGIWGDVTLVAHSDVYVQDLFIKPSVRKGELVVDYTIANESAKAVETELQATVEDQNGDVLKLPTATMTIPSGGSQTKTIRMPWQDARYWSHEDPYLYHLRSELSTGDCQRTRFGFREFWIEGHRYVLNGSKVNLLGSSWWPPTEQMTRDEIESQWRALRAAGVNCFRTHTQPWRRVHYDVADEVGLLMIVEGPVWHDPYCTAYQDPRFWDNYAQSIRAMLSREKNRPSVIMWSMGNELYSGEEKTRLAVAGLAKIGQIAKQTDPTRPIYFESDGDPQGVADAIGMHYVHEYPKHTCWPNEAYWLDKPFNPKTWFGIKSEPTAWKKEKPLYIGEFLWVPSGTPAPHTVFFGDDAYRDLDLYTRKAKGESWKMQVLAFRHHEAGGMCPWTVGTDLDESNPLYQAHQYAYQPIAAYCLDYDQRFYAKETVPRRVEVFNDSLSDSELRFAWSLNQGEQTIATEARMIALKAGEKRLLTLQLSMPNVESRTPLAWQLTLRRDGKQVFHDTHAYSVFPKLSLPTSQEALSLFDPVGATANVLSKHRVDFKQIKSIEKVDSSSDLLVIGDGAFQSDAATDGKGTVPMVGRTDPQRAALIDFVVRGGRVLVLRQDSYPEGLFDLGPTPHESTMTFPTRPGHPALRGIRADDLKFWRGDHLVTDHELPRPSTGAAVSIVVSGSNTGISHAPLLEIPLGRGTLVHCQLRLIEKSAQEPAAGLMLGNLLDYLANYKPAERKTAVIGADDKYRELLRELNLHFDELTAADRADLSQYSLVIVRGEADGLQTFTHDLKAFVDGGGHLLVHRPAPETMDLVCEALNVGLVAQPWEGAVTRAEGDDPLLEAITREDLYWSEKQPGLSWSRQPLSQQMIDGVFGHRFDAQGAVEHEIEKWKLSGQYVTANDSGVLFATAGTASGEVDFPESGKYGLGIRARGTACRGVYPIAQLSIDGNPLGSVALVGDQWQDYGVQGHVAKGRHEVTVSFVNDSADPPREDRNLEVDKLLVVRDHRADDTVFLTAPPATVVERLGQGVVVFDRVRWDTEQSNSRKAARYAGSLLTALGADFRPKSAVTLECEQMTPQAEMPHYDTDGSTAYMGSGGYIGTMIEVAESKRYTAELVASGDDSEGICPLVEIRLDGQAVGEVQLTTEAWRSYLLELDLPKGKHELSLWFMNDHYAPSGDRNLRLDKLLIYNDSAEN